MFEEINIEMDENGNYYSDVVGLLHLLKSGHLPHGTMVSADLGDGEDECFFVKEIDDSYALVLEYEDIDPNLYSYIELDELLIQCDFYCQIPEESTNQPVNNEEHYTQITDAEAFSRIRKKEDVYYSTENHTIEPLTKDVRFSLKQLHTATYFVKGMLRERDSFDRKLDEFFNHYEIESKNSFLDIFDEEDFI